MQQQERFDDFVEEFNQQRPHEALEMKRPADVHAPSPRPFSDSLPEPCYSAYDDVIRVNRSGQIYIAGLGQVPLSAALAGEYVGIREERDGRWLVSFAGVDLGYAHPDKTMTPMTSTPPEAATK